jgi:transposase
MRRYDLTDREWARLEPLFPPRKPRTGRPNHDHRRIVSGILWVLRTGAHGATCLSATGRRAPFRAGSTAGGRRGSGIASWPASKPRRTPAAGSIGAYTSWTPPSSARISTPPGPAGPAPSGGADEALGRSQGGFSTKIHLRAEGGGKPVTFVLTGGERHESRTLPALLSRGAVRRPGRGRPRLRPQRVAGDKAFTGRPVRAFLRRRGIGAVIPTQKREPRRPGFDREAYRRRNRIERLINRLKQFRRIATRYEKRAVNYAAMLTIGMSLLWL